MELVAVQHEQQLEAALQVEQLEAALQVALPMPMEQLEAAQLQHEQQLEAAFQVAIQKHHLPQLTVACLMETIII